MVLIFYPSNRKACNILYKFRELLLMPRTVFKMLAMVANTYNSSTWEVETDEYISGSMANQPTLSQKIPKTWSDYLAVYYFKDLYVCM